MLFFRLLKLSFYLSLALTCLFLLNTFLYQDVAHFISNHLSYNITTFKDVNGFKDILPLFYTWTDSFLESYRKPFLIIIATLSFILFSMQFWFIKKNFELKAHGANAFFNTLKTVNDLRKHLNHESFEDFVAYLYRRKGHDAHRIGAGSESGHVDYVKDNLYGDGGRDVIIKRKFRKDILVQCKFFNDTNYVTVQTVREMYGVLHHYKAAKIIIVTTSFFSKDAQNFAKGKKGLILVDRNELDKMLKQIH